MFKTMSKPFVNLYLESVDSYIIPHLFKTFFSKLIIRNSKQIYKNLF